MKKLLSFILLLFLFFACREDGGIDLEEDEYLIFGHYYGFCVGEECVETFKLTNEKLYEDISDSYAGQGTFQFQELRADQFELVKDLINDFPEKLLDEESQTFGCPDCADQGGLYISFKDRGKEAKFWKIDQDKNQVPTNLHVFMDEVNQKIAIINAR